MKLSQAAILTVLASNVLVEAAPALMADNANTRTLSKRGELEKALAEFQELQAIRAKRDDVAAELSAREYTIVTNVLTAIKDTDLAPTVLKFFIKNSTLSTVAINSVVLVVKSGFISVKNLLSLLVQSGLITSVLNDILGNCEVYASILSIVESLIKTILKREEGEEVPDFVTHEQGLELLRRDGLILPSEFDTLESTGLDTRDVDDVVINLLESLAKSGLASQVVETVLTDTSFLAFGAKLLQTLYADGLLSISSLVSAVAESGLLPALLKEVLNFSTLSTIARTAISAISGNCSSKSAVLTTATTTTSTGGSFITGILGGGVGGASGATTRTIATSTRTSTAGSTSTSPSILGGLLGSIIGGSGIVSGVSNVLDDLFGDGSSASTSRVTATATTRTTAVTTKATATVAANSLYACTTTPSLLAKRRVRFY